MVIWDLYEEWGRSCQQQRSAEKVLLLVHTSLSFIFSALYQTTWRDLFHMREREREREGERERAYILCCGTQWDDLTQHKIALLSPLWYYFKRELIF